MHRTGIGEKELEARCSDGTNREDKVQILLYNFILCKHGQVIYILI
jgi:hypothetical protein